MFISSKFNSIYYFINHIQFINFILEFIINLISFKNFKILFYLNSIVIAIYCYYFHKFYLDLIKM